MKQYYVKFTDNWADEMYVGGILMIDEYTFNKFKYAIDFLQEYEQNNEFVGIWISFGTNQDTDYDSIEEFINCIEYGEIPENEINIISKYLWDENNVVKRSIEAIMDVSKAYDIK